MKKRTMLRRGLAVPADPQVNMPDFVIIGTDQVGSRSDFPNNPAVQVEVNGPSGSKKQWLFSKFPRVHRTGGAPLELRFRRVERLGGVIDYVLVLKEADGKPVLAHVRNGRLVKRTGVDPGEPVDIEGTDYRIAIDRFFENANMSAEVVNQSDMPGRPAIEITIEQDGSATPLYLWEQTPADVSGYKMLYLREDRIRDFYSILQIVEGDDVIAQKKIEVNDPLLYSGYALYQSSYDDENQAWSGLQVKKDPGVPLVYAGFLVLISGMIIIFYINPLLAKAKKSVA